MTRGRGERSRPSETLAARQLQANFSNWLEIIDPPQQQSGIPTHLQPIGTRVRFWWYCTDELAEEGNKDSLLWTEGVVIGYRKPLKESWEHIIQWTADINKPDGYKQDYSPSFSGLDQEGNQFLMHYRNFDLDDFVEYWDDGIVPYSEGLILDGIVTTWEEQG